MDPDSFSLEDGLLEEEEPDGRLRTRETTGWFSHSAADRDVARIRALHRRQAQMYLQEQRAILVALNITDKRPLTDMQMVKIRSGLELLTDEDLRKRLREIDVFLSRTTLGALKIAKAHDAVVGACDDDALRRTIRSEFLRCATTFTEEDWSQLDAIRAAQEKGVRMARAVARVGQKRMRAAAAERQVAAGGNDSSSEESA